MFAISGLGSHPFASFTHKEDGHICGCATALPQDMPGARVMIYRYESGLPGSTSFAQLDDLASSLHIEICRLLRSGEQKQLVFVGHSLGSLLIKEALTRMEARPPWPRGAGATVNRYTIHTHVRGHQLVI